MNDRVLQTLGLCRRAGRLTIGADPCVESLNSGKSRLILYASDFSENSVKPVLAAAASAGVRTIGLKNTKQELSLALGKLCGVVSVEDNGFAEGLIKKIGSDE